MDEQPTQAEAVEAQAQAEVAPQEDVGVGEKRKRATKKGTAYEPQPVPAGVAWLEQLAAQPVTRPEEELRARDVQSVHYVLYDAYDGDVVVFATTKDGKQHYVKLRMKECRRAYKDYIERLQGLELAAADLEADFLSLQDVRSSLETWLLERRATGKHRREPQLSEQDCLEASLHFARLLEQFALQAGATRSRGQLGPMEFVGHFELADLLVPRSWLPSLFSAARDNTPWFTDACTLPSEQDFTTLLSRKDSAVEKPKASKERLKYEKLYARLSSKQGRAQKRRKTDTMKETAKETPTGQGLMELVPEETPLPGPPEDLAACEALPEAPAD